MEQAIITMQERGTLRNTQEISAGLLDSFIAYLDCSQKSVQTYARSLKQLFNFLSERGITQPRREDIIAYRDELRASGHKPTTIQAYITAAKLLFSWTEQAGIYPNIAQHIKGAKLNRDHKKDYLTSRQVKELLSGIDRTSEQGQRDYAILLLMITGGLRTIEIIRADIGDIRNAGDATVIYIQGKGREEKTDFITLSEHTEAAIREYLKTRGETDEAAPLFTSNSNKNKGGRLSTRSVSRLAKEALRIAGYDSPRLTAHSLRHTAVTLSIMEGRSLEEVQQFARHADISTTMIYNHALDRTKNKCSEAIAAAIFA